MTFRPGQLGPADPQLQPHQSPGTRHVQWNAQADNSLHRPQPSVKAIKLFYLSNCQSQFVFFELASC